MINIPPITLLTITALVYCPSVKKQAVELLPLFFIKWGLGSLIR